MIGISQIQFPSKDSSKLKFVSYFGAFVSLSIITNPVNVLFSLGTMFFRSEIKTLYIYKEIKTAKQQKMSKREYWEIFFKNNTIKVAAFLLFSAFITYLTFTTTFLLISLLGTIPLTMLLILLQSELRPKDFNPFTLLKASINFFLESIKENLRGMVNSFDVKLEHLLPHQLNDDIIKNIDKLKGKYSEQVPEDVIKNDEYIQFIGYINNSYEFSDEDKGRVIAFLDDFCKDDQKHSSGFTGGQVLLLVLRACNDGDGEAVKSKKDALISNLIDSQTFSRKERIPNTCFTGIIYRMLSTLEGIHPDPEIRFTPPREMLLSEAQNKAREFMLDRLKNKKNNKEILKAWYDVQNGYEDDESQKIVDDFISEVSIPLMRKLLSITSQYSEQIVLTLMKNISSIKLNKLQCCELVQHMRNKLQEHDLDDQESLLENIGKKVFLELLNRDLLETDFSLKDSSLDGAKRIANKIIEEEVAEFKLKAEKTIEGQIISMLDGLRMLPREKRCYRVYVELSKNNENDKEKIKKILQERLKVTKAAMDEMLKKGASHKLELEIESVYEGNKDHVTQLYEKIRETKKEFIEDGLLTPQEVENITKAKIIDLNKEDKIIPSSNLSRSLSVNNLAVHYL
ncbi:MULTISPECIES: hypothetical protein [Wolbachia]|uniref:hypothetical protein n=1 Tax=Wolbachia TaxID=953 RepID=UPI0003B2B117|nr:MULTISPECIES: hypothetical protein [Wolbachia]ERN55290.1 hypothetical protein WMELPOP_05314 [Wolbachia pipientis wMelPop]QQL96550.1 hypothetical protein GQX71_05210 [Wolbachia endosymbiont of Drosophila melanogaster]QQL97691.1 hypothetical protein GQX70_05220 [Wolbachia endosymbiont of Drosophila melanogaster]QQL98822.1 hypothetical protein GQX69_05035 [Wolbachia endosymbiont of Drosophila melanogaster]QQM00050.1 hypothetical protein GQX68_05105 [Wolbachia endosymbiont of Drosophila melanog